MSFSTPPYQDKKIANISRDFFTSIPSFLDLRDQSFDFAKFVRLLAWKLETFKMTDVEVRQIAVLETVEDIQNRRDEVLRRYAEFKEATRKRRQRLEDAKCYHQFKRDADEVEAWINEKLQIACDENYKDPTNLQVSFCERNLLLRKEK